MAVAHSCYETRLCDGARAKRIATSRLANTKMSHCFHLAAPTMQRWCQLRLAIKDGQDCEVAILKRSVVRVEAWTGLAKVKSNAIRRAG